MNIGIVGLGLIGGSLAKAFKLKTPHKIFGYDNDDLTVKCAVMLESIDEILNGETISCCDYIFIALYPKATIDFIKENSAEIKKGAVAVDCGGVKSSICEQCFSAARSNGFIFIGGHPMAGTQFSGFKYSSPELFDDESMVLVPDRDEDIRVIEALKKLLRSIGFSGVSITTAEKHDKIIAYTSQLAHVVSNAYVKSPNAQVHKGFSAGSYRDLTRVAKLNENMWAELFLENADNLSSEIDFLIESLKKYSAAIKEGNYEVLKELLREGRECKERADGK